VLEALRLYLGCVRLCALQIDIYHYQDTLCSITITKQAFNACQHNISQNYYNTLHPFNGLFSRTTWVSRHQKGKTSLDLNEARDYGVLGWQWHQLDHMQTICTLLQTDNHTNTSSLSFYRPDALPDTQPTVSKHIQS